MSFQITAAGTVDQAKAQVKAAPVYYGSDNSQMEAVRAFLLAELGAWPADGHFKGVFVSAQGHADEHSGRSVQLEIRPVYLPEVPDAAEAGG